MKLLILGFDGVEPSYIFDKIDEFPTLSKMMATGISTQYSAYVQKGYNDSYLSEMNWSSIYTGLEPWKHKIATKCYTGERVIPEMSQFENLDPFWKVLNSNGLSVALWNADCCRNPIDIDGYVVSSIYSAIENGSTDRTAERTLQYVKNNSWLSDILDTNPPARIYPQMIIQKGYTFEQLKQDDELAMDYVEKNHFAESTDNLKAELDYYFTAMTKAQEINPVDVMFFYSPTTDLIAHCSMCSDYNDVLMNAYNLIDKEVGKLIDKLNPDNVVFLSDHGMVNFKDLVNSCDKEIQKEAFAARDQVLWLKNGYIAFEAHNGALLFTAHGLKGLFVASGKDIERSEITDMRTIDIYPTILDICGAKIPAGREGYVQSKCTVIANQNKAFDSTKVSIKKVAIIQCHDPGYMDIVINEIYLHDRFIEITVVGNSRYSEIFINNPRVKNFCEYDDFIYDKYDEIYVSSYSDVNNKLADIRIK